jgi:acyl-coenzyme A thioesterase PaaI-like protein
MDEVAARFAAVPVNAHLGFMLRSFDASGAVVARSTMLRRGRTVAVVRSDVHQGETHVLTGLFTDVILPPRPAARA